ncbi:hypothetical protein BCR34DRAFT_584517 [Clohesyomyces aquaticus]|uniref:Probable double zinc ribbon domain-containing protein n=1 Tax=Clohesyomyces aquaticus TaxID=1231657 RepID=A0A1Y2A1D1_9PLEO|nr:hypothetical protein BCR34DRAFT_584517 [Clohesyomyces aquaticus]
MGSANSTTVTDSRNVPSKTTSPFGSTFRRMHFRFSTREDAQSLLRETEAEIARLQRDAASAMWESDGPEWYPEPREQTPSYLLRADADGVWYCPCSQENHLVEISGPHLFGFLKCGRCDRPYTAKCFSTDVLQYFAAKDEALSLCRGSRVTSLQTLKSAPIADSRGGWSWRL